MRQRLSDQDIMRALSACCERPDRLCARCPFYTEQAKECDNLEYYALQLIQKLQSEKVGLQQRLDAYEGTKKMIEEVFKE